jgi:hypothetical protein
MEADVFLDNLDGRRCLLPFFYLCFRKTGLEEGERVAIGVTGIAAAVEEELVAHAPLQSEVGHGKAVLLQRDEFGQRTETWRFILLTSYCLVSSSSFVIVAFFPHWTEEISFVILQPQFGVLIGNAGVDKDLWYLFYVCLYVGMSVCEKCE